MPRPIDADALKLPSELPVDPYDDPYFRGVYSGWNNAIRECKDLIDSAPTVSPDDVRGVGKWKLGYFGSISDATEKWYDKLLQGGFLYCSACKCRSNAKTNYCPNCGTKMEVSEDA